MIFRAFGHNSLSAHWIILAAIWFIILEYRNRLWRGAWVVLFFVAVLVNLYFVAMLIPLWGISLFIRYSRENHKWGLILDLCSVIVVLLLLGYCLGFFSLKINNLSEIGFGYYSWNLNGLINPYTYSSILNPMPLGLPEQYEGYSYLGLGNLVIFSVAFLLYFQNNYTSRHKKFLIPFVLVSILYILYSLSNKAFINDLRIWEIDLPAFVDTLCSALRSSGRFIWPVYYFIVLFGLISVNKNLKYSSPLLILAIVIQLIDIQPLYSEKTQNGFVDYHSPMQAEFWQAAAKTNKNIIILPATKKAHSQYQPIAMFAQQNDMTLNWGYFARANYAAIEKDGEEIWEELLADKVDYQTLYFLLSPELEAIVNNSHLENIIICKVDGFDVALSTKNELFQNNIDPSRYCYMP